MSNPETTSPLSLPPARRRQIGFWAYLLGLLVQTIGLKPAWFGLAHTATVGLMQLLVFISGLGLVIAGGYLEVTARWEGRQPLPFWPDVGLRLAFTGYLLTAIAALADILGFGSHPNPSEAYFGPWQAAGILVGEGLILAGFLMAWPRQRETAIS